MLSKEFLSNEGYLIIDLESYDLELYNELKSAFNTTKSKNSIGLFRMDSSFKDVDTAKSIYNEYGYNDYSVNDNHLSAKFNTNHYEELKNKLLSIALNTQQVWFQDTKIIENGLADISDKINRKLVAELYDTTYRNTNPQSSDLTLYTDNCFIENHSDGDTSQRNCVILIYLNHDWKEEYGGELIVGNNIWVAPTFGKIVILDFLYNNIEHAVNKVKNGFERYALIRFVGR